MASRRQKGRATTSRANEMETEQSGPSNLPRQREEVVQEVHEIQQHEVVPPPTTIDLDHIDEIITYPRAYLTEIVRDNRSLS